MTLFKNLSVGATVEGGEALVEDLKTGITKRKTKYYTLTLRDTDGSTLKAQVWEESLVPEWVAVGEPIQFSASVSSYNDAKQMVVGKIGRAIKTTAADYLKSTDKDVSALWYDIKNRLEGMTGTFEKVLADEFLSNVTLENHFKKAPAATKVHNNWIGGLIEHAHAMCKLADGICDHYMSYYPELKKDFVILGCVLHDLGKIFEYDSDNPAFPKTARGIIVNHIVWGPAWVYKVASNIMDRLKLEKEEAQYALKDLDDVADNASVRAEMLDEINDRTTALREIQDGRDFMMHLIASHHGKIEWGSPVVPATIEAIILHYIDNMDTHTMHALDAIKKEGSIKGFSEKSYVYGTEFKI